MREKNTDDDTRWTTGQKIVRRIREGETGGQKANVIRDKVDRRTLVARVRSATKFLSPHLPQRPLKYIDSRLLGVENVHVFANRWL